MSLAYSQEQQKIFSIGPGYSMVVANAGTGKTESCSEFFVLRYMAEEQALFPSVVAAGRHVSGEDQIRILKQFRAVTFTTKASEELDHRIKLKLKARGVPEPMQGDRPFMVCRTLDSFLQRWLSHPMMARAWMKEDTARASRIKQALSLMPPQTRESLLTGVDASKEYAREMTFNRKWGALIDETAKAVMIYSVVCDILRYPCPDKLKPAALRQQFDEYLRRVPYQTHSLSTGFWKSVVPQVAEAEHGPKQLYARYTSGKCELEEHRELGERLTPWLKKEQICREFLLTYEIARAQGYHPTTNPQQILTRMTMETLASNSDLCSFHTLQRIAAGYEELKLHTLAMDFGDYLYTVQKVFVAQPFLLEKAKEYPTLGFRGKYVIWDEAQDNSPYQFWILNLLCGKPESKFQTLVVGDFKQAIYGWRGANPDEFINCVRFLRNNAPERLLSLTTSYRSCKRIVALGNQIVSELPSYKESVIDSETVFSDDGEIIMSPPLPDEQAEKLYVQKAIEEIRRKHGPKSSIMILVRANLEINPTVVWALSLEDPNIVALTGHRSKGLQADHCFVLGCAAGAIPDCRADSDQEINLFYVMCTRARMSLYLTVPVITTTTNKEGQRDTKYVGPSPFFSKVPILTAIALREGSGWDAEMLKKGLGCHNQQVMLTLTKKEDKKKQLISEADTFAPGVKVDFTKRVHQDTGATWRKGMSKPIPRPIETTEFTDTRVSTVESPESRRVLTICLEGLRKAQRLPKLESPDFKIALREGWLAKKDDRWQPTDKLMHLLKK